MGQMLTQLYLKLLNRYSADEMCDADEVAQRTAAWLKQKRRKAFAILLFILVIVSYFTPPILASMLSVA